MSSPKILLLPRNKVDVVKWDECIAHARNGLIYGYSFYLDHMSRHWDALVTEDYKIVMPLTWNRKFGMYYLYQPAFAALLGIFGNDLTDEVISGFIKAIPSKFRLIEISLNQGNVLTSLTPYMKLQSNFTLSLDRPYEELLKGYRENTRRNLKRAEQAMVKYETNTPIQKIIEFSKKQMKNLTNIRDIDYSNFEHLFLRLKKNGLASTCGVYLLNELVASAVFFFSHHRAYYILVGNHPNGKTVGASHYLVDRFIQTHAGQNLTLDFEGSDINSLAFFYSSFGAKLEKYPVVRMDRLPWWVKFLRG